MVALRDGASLLHQPSRTSAQALSRAKLILGDISLVEINEAFAAVNIASMRELGFTNDNVNGGVIALGHPICMSGSYLAA